MIKKLTLLFVLSFVSCEYLNFKTSKEENTEPKVASVLDKNLYVSTLKESLPQKISGQDSLIMVKSIINSWATKQILLGKAEDNISEKKSEEINDLVEKYRQSLYINWYKEQLIKQQLDTAVTFNEVEDYYINNKEKFKIKLNQELVQLKYIHFGKDFLEKKEVIKKFTSDKEEDLNDLQDQTINFIKYKLDDSSWYTIEQVLEDIPQFKADPREILLKKSKLLQKEDSLGVYLVAIKNVLKINDMAPITYIEPSIKRLILHKRKLELVRDIEKTLLNDAIKNQQFKEY